MAGTVKPTDTKTRVVGHALSRVIARCPAAWSVLARPVRRFFDERAAGWDTRTGAGTATYLAPLAAATGKVETDPERVLDLGCGTGEGTLFLAREYPRASVRGVDVSEAMIERAQAKVGLDPEARFAFRVADAADLPYSDRSFDLICQVNLPLFHEEIPRLLRSGGRFLLVSSHGADTPFFTPVRTATALMERHGMTLLDQGSVGDGSFMVFGRVGEAAELRGSRSLG